MKNSKPSFKDLKVNPYLTEALEREGITAPFPIQAATLPEAIGGKDILGKGQTGSGKTLAFGLALLTRLAGKTAKQNQPLALILAPTRELAMQINDVLDIYAGEVGLASTVLAGGMPYPPQLQALRRGTQIVVATPGRLQDHMKRGSIDLSAIKIVVLDEADQMADMGFLPVVTEVLAQTPEHGQRLLFSATLDRDVDKLVKRFMRDPIRHELAIEESRAVDMEHHVLVVDSHVKEDVIAQIAAREGRTIFFVRTKHGADRLTERLRKQGVDVGVLHGGRTQKQRMRVLEAFKFGRKSALIATDVAARGIHVDDVSLVVHVDPAENHKDYLHRAGRTARAGTKGTVVSIASHSQRKRVHGLGKSAGVKMSETKVDSLHPDLLRITGAQAPSGVPVEDEPTPRAERSKPGRSRGPRERHAGNRFEKRERAPKRPDREKREPREKKEFRKEERPARKTFEKSYERGFEKRENTDSRRFQKRADDRAEKRGKNTRPGRRERAIDRDEAPKRGSNSARDRYNKKPFETKKLAPRAERRAHLQTDEAREYAAKNPKKPRTKKKSAPTRGKNVDPRKKPRTKSRPKGKKVEYKPKRRSKD